MTTGQYRIKVAAAVAIGLAVIAAATGLARRAFPPPANGVETARNPYRFRDWPAYVDSLRTADGAACVALISDSQAYGGNIRRATAIRRGWRRCSTSGNRAASRAGKC